MEREQEKTGRIASVRKNSFLIDFEGREVMAKLKGSFYEEAPDRRPVVGDHVTFIYSPAGDSVIRAVRDRKNLLARPDQARTGVMQYMAANVDYCFIVTSLNGDYSYNRIARYAGIALQGGAVPVAVLTKADLCAETERYVRETAAVSDRLRVHAVSALTGAGLEQLEEYFAPGKTICLMGSSGAGKSTLINAMAGEEVMKTGAVREADAKGRHTTTSRQLIRLKNGACVIDMPGMREVGMARAEDGIDGTFADIVALESRCRFRNCRHGTEPGCAVRAAIESGALPRERWALYRSLGEENRNNYAKKKDISKRVKAMKKSRDRSMPD
ncbi:MAG: ribosome small subunit-dependent GTPase A [Lachnospiraceae bacterium]|nr:ribosome small subunit-dependent GTPase A [Lachnospiraceae bacterium]